MNSSLVVGAAGGAVAWPCPGVAGGTVTRAKGLLRAGRAEPTASFRGSLCVGVKNAVV